MGQRGSKAARPKKLILVVHGIGEQVAGETLDDLAGAASEKNKAARVQSDVRMLADEHDDGEGRDVELFPCHIRRVNGEKSDLVFSEVFWADLSRGKSGILSTAYELIKGILGLSHAVRENANILYPNGHLLKSLSAAFVHALHGPIAVLNLLLAAGALFAYGVFKLFDNVDDGIISEDIDLWAGGSVALIGGIAVIAGYFFSQMKYNAADSYFFRIFGKWLYFLGFGLIALFLLTGFPDVLGISTQAQIWLCKQVNFDCGLVGFNWYGFVLIQALRVVWFLTLIGLSLMLIVQFLSIVLHQYGKSKTAPPLYAVLCAIMAVVWMVLSASFWTSVDNVIPNDAIDTVLFKHGLELILIIWIMVAVIIGAAWIAFFRWGKQTAASWLAAEEGQRNENDYKHNAKSRLFISGWLEWAFGVAIIVLTAGSLSIAIGLINTEHEWTKFITAINKHGFGISVILSVIVGYLYLQFWDKVAAGLGVGKDMITYFKGELVIKDGKEAWNYPARSRIHRRFDTVMETMIAAEKPSEVIVVSHSQGTVIAIEAIRDNLDSALFGDGVKIRKLVTMGSPYSHIYEYYFPDDKGNKGFKIPTKADLKNKFDSWVNIFRIDDFVGTIVGKQDSAWPENKPVDSGGHTGYWTDREVLAILNNQIIKP